MNKQKKSEQIECILIEYGSIFGNDTGTFYSFASRIRAIERELNTNDISLIDWLNTATNGEDPYQKAMEIWDDSAPNASTQKVARSWKAAYHKLVLYVLGQYDADLYMALNDKSTDLELCKLVARNALFCTAEVAYKVKKGEYGSKENMNNGGNDYYSWFDCSFQRKQGKYEQRGYNVTDKQGVKIQFHNHDVLFDDNTQANLAIKNAINKGLGLPLSNAKFEGYMACHVWDNSCRDNHFHTSVFNLVLLPKSIGGLSDYNNAVKRLLQYESAMRFGVYPQNYNSTKFNKKPRYYDEVESLWRQPKEHELATNNIVNRKKLSALQ